MPRYADQSIRLKTFLLMAMGEEYGEPGRKSHLVIDRRLSQVFKGQDKQELEACGFDIGSIRNSFETHDQARTHLKAIQSGKLKINNFRKIDPQDIRIHEFVYEAHAIEFDDAEHEIMTVIGAIDAMKYQPRELIKAAFPALRELRIMPPLTLPQQTRNGDPSAISLSVYVTVSPKMKDDFNRMAANLAQGDSVPVPTDISLANFVNGHYYGGSFFRGGLSSVVEEIGKVRLQLLNEAGENHTDILQLRLYDYNNTFKPQPRPQPEDIRFRALKALSEQDPVIARTILEALKVRGLDPLQDKPEDNANLSLPRLEMACK